MSKKLTAGPWHNPVLPEGIYDAEIRSVTQGTYGTQHDPVIQIRFWLPKIGQCILTNLYFPSGAVLRPAKRLWHFTNMVGLHSADIGEDPASFEGRTLRLDVRTTIRNGTSYSDIHEFLPALQVAPSACPPASKAKQYTLVEYT